MFYKFENLNVWKESIEFVDFIYEVTKGFPKEEQFGLTNQIRRAAVSIALNIAEGSDKGSDPDFIRFLRISLGSLNEVVTGLYISRNQTYLDEKLFEEAYQESTILTKQIKALIKSIK